ncbi:hypothetical protein FHX48_002281 [Microbacterium halimionae]|uniref:BMP family ABC transporter substrate-binding protein n=1 Tax=Microbacterium halimionae TaxID=1526413 RepID=A0A7W3PMH2_9MICO|nr:hypothetical protein [Microbacterium halimionae]MBA8817183.1 hypothetical protein [Microbacterium halimionae]NII94633.1 hypothetical protein [Microbacterium halimionae]
MKIPRSLVPGLAALALSSALVGCTASFAPETTASTTAFADDVVPEPGRTIEAAEIDANTDTSLTGYRIAVVNVASAGSDAMLDGVVAFAEEKNADVEIFDAADGDDVAGAVGDAIAAHPDLVVGLGESVVDTFSFETAQVLYQQFLILGAQVAEPTANVTAVIWEGATSRGSAASADGDLNGANVTAEFSRSVVGVGVASIEYGVTGVIVAVDAPG